MKFVDYINNLSGKTAIFVDMDGVIADYDNDPTFDKFSVGFYSKKRPIETTIKILQEISKNKNVTLYLLSGPMGEEDALKEKEKNEWIDKNASFFKKENRIFTSLPTTTIDGKKTGKAQTINEVISVNDYDNVFQIDDDVRVIKGTNSCFNGKVKMLHVISILD